MSIKKIATTINFFIQLSVVVAYFYLQYRIGCWPNPCSNVVCTDMTL